MALRAGDNRTRIREEAKYFLHPSFLIPLLAVTATGFGYSVLHPAAGVDDLCRSRYVAGGWYLRVSRPGAWLVMWISEKLGLTQTGSAVLIALFMAVSAVAICMLFRREARGALPRLCYTVFACLFVAYPIAAENFVYADTGMWVALGYGLICASIMLCAPSPGAKRRRLPRLIAAVLLCAFCISMFQSLATAFICLAGAVLALNIFCDPNARFSRVLSRGLTMAGVLGAAVLLAALVSRVCIHALQLTPLVMGTQDIVWFSSNYTIGQRLASLGRNYVRNILTPALFYAPLAALVIAYLFSLVACLYALIKRRAVAILPIAVMTLSTVLMPIVQGYFVAYRVFQSFAPYVAFMGMLLTAWAFAAGRRKRLGTAVGALCICLSLMQALQLRKAFVIDDQRYQEDRQVAEEVISALTADPVEREKPVAFVGCYQPSRQLTETGVVTTEDRRYDKLYGRIDFLRDEQRYMDFPTNSLIGWATIAFDDDGAEMVRFCRYLGCEDITCASNEQYDEALVKAQTMPAFPADGYIADAGDYRIVKLGPTEPTQEEG